MNASKQLNFFLKSNRTFYKKSGEELSTFINFALNLKRVKAHAQGKS